MNDYIANLNETYKKPFMAFVDNYPNNITDFTRNIDEFSRTCAIMIWENFNISPETAIKALAEIYLEEKNKKTFLSSEYSETIAYIAKNHRILKVPDFFQKMINYDVKNQSNYSRTFAEGLKILCVSFALINDEITEQSCNTIERITRILFTVCDSAKIAKLSKTINIYDYVTESKLTNNQKTEYDTSSNSNYENIESPMEQLKNLIGLADVKKEIESISNFINVQQLRKQQGYPTTVMSYHLVFTGNPGTGKTTVARLVAKIYKELGILSNGHLIETDRSGLVGGYVGQTAIKTTELIEKAKGGVLFIDEAYTLNSKGENDFGQEAIDTLLKAMEDNRDNLVVIVAGYDNLMSNFIDSNPGLKSRFNRFIHFTDYNVSELMEIFKSLCKSNGYNLSSKAEDKVYKYFKTLKSSNIKNFANGREVRNLFEKVIQNQANRISSLTNNSTNELSEITEEDIIEIEINSDRTLEDIINDFDSLIGLENVKREIHDLISYVKIQKKRKDTGLQVPNISLHLVFSGNPGTGKTTVARYIAEIYKALGLIKKSTLIETDRSGLVAGYVGQTAIKTKDIIESALGGVLFIDEAYTLLNNSPNDFGQEAIDTLLKAMEDQRDNLVVIVAGYKEQIKMFIDSNPGLKSRFNRYINFTYYSGDEMLQIFKLYCSKNQYILEQEAEKELLTWFKNISANKISNGRGVRNIFEKVISIQSKRLVESNEITDLSKIICADIKTVLNIIEEATQ